MKDTLKTVSPSFICVYENQSVLIRFLNALNVPVPPALVAASTVALNGQLQQALERPEIDTAVVKNLLREASANHITLDSTTLEYTMRKRLEEQSALFAGKPRDLGALKRLHAMLDIALTLPFPVYLWRLQNLSFAQLVNGTAARAHVAGRPQETAVIQVCSADRAGLRDQL